MLKMSLCEGRHKIPQAVDGGIFKLGIKDVTDVEKLETDAFNAIWGACYSHYKENEKCLEISPKWDGEDATPLIIAPGLHLDLYATGLTVALIAVINICKREQIDLTVWHYNKATGDYYSQEVLL